MDLVISLFSPLRSANKKNGIEDKEAVEDKGSSI